jgi:hypothetical protein
MQCDHFLPHRPSGLLEYPMPQCRLEQGHPGEHEVVLPHGRVMRFEYDHECGCETEDWCGCYAYRFVEIETV